MEFYFDMDNDTYFKLLPQDAASEILSSAGEGCSLNYYLIGCAASSGTIVINDTHYRFEPFDSVIIAYNDTFYVSDYSKPTSIEDDNLPSAWRFLLVDLDAFLQTEYHHKEPSVKQIRTLLSKGSCMIRAKEQPSFTSLAARLLDEWEEHREYYRQEAVDLMRLLILELFRSRRAQIDRSHSAATRDYIEPVLAFIKHNYREPIEISDLAGVSGLSGNHFRRLFEEYTGETPNVYLNRFRVDVAKELLLRDDLRLEDVRMRTGFSTITAFYRNFEKFTGMPPGEWRKIKNTAPSLKD